MWRMECHGKPKLESVVNVWCEIIPLARPACFNYNFDSARQDLGTVPSHDRPRPGYLILRIPGTHEPSEDRSTGRVAPFKICNTSMLH